MGKERTRVYSATIFLFCFLASTASARTWTDCTGLNKIEGDIASVANDVVTLRKTDGTTVKLAIDKFSAADVTFIRQYIKKAQSEHKAPPDSAASEVEKQAATINDFIKKLRDQIDTAVAEDTSVRMSAAHDAVVASLDAELKRTNLVFRFPVTNVSGNRNYTLTLLPPERIVGITGYPRTFVTTFAASDAVKITTNHVLVVRGHGRLTYGSDPSQVYSTASCLADIYIPSTKQYYGIYLDGYTWKAEREITYKPKPQELGMPAPLARQIGGPPPLVDLEHFGQNNQPPNGLPPATNNPTPNGQTSPTAPSTTQPLVDLEHFGQNNPPQNGLPPATNNPTPNGQTSPTAPSTTPAPALPVEEPVQPTPQHSQPVRPRVDPPQQTAERHTMDLKLPSAVYVHDKLTPAKHDQRVARSKQMFGPYYETWKARPYIWVGGFIDSTFWYSMESWTADRQAMWLWNYQNVIDADLLNGRLSSDNALHEAYWKLKVSNPAINPYYVDPAFTDEPDLMYRDEFVEAIYNDSSPVDNWTMPYSWLVGSCIAGIILVVAWSKHEGYF